MFEIYQCDAIKEIYIVEMLKVGQTMLRMLPQRNED